MTDELEAYAYLWDGSAPGWVLWYLPVTPAEDDPANYSIFNTADSTALLIEDDDVYARVIAEMRRRGVGTITEPPS